MRSHVPIAPCKPLRRLVLLMSSPEELRPFLRWVPHRRLVFRGSQAWEFQAPRFAGLALLAGMGGERPLRLAEQAVADYSPQLLGVAGFGGGLTASPPPGGILVPAQYWRLGPSGSLSRLDVQAPAPSEALAALLRAAGLSAATGALLTLPAMIPKASLPAHVFRLPHPVLDLETAPLAALARARGLPLLAVRAVTDAGGEEIQPFLADLINRWQRVPLSRLLPALAADPRRVDHCLHLWRRARLAGDCLARALYLILNHLCRPGSHCQP